MSWSSGSTGSIAVKKPVSAVEKIDSVSKKAVSVVERIDFVSNVGREAVSMAERTDSVSESLPGR